MQNLTTFGQDTLLNQVTGKRNFKIKIINFKSHDIFSKMRQFLKELSSNVEINKVR